jgi:hypothetical protein
LCKAVPNMSAFNIQVENSAYCHLCYGAKACYLSAGITGSTDMLYAYIVSDSESCSDVTYSAYLQHSYECVDCVGGYGLRYCQRCQSSKMLYSCLDCTNCEECSFCVNLDSKKYCLLNEQLTEEEYARCFADILSNPEKYRKEYLALVLSSPRRHAYTIGCEESVGDVLMNTKRSFDCYDSIGAENCKYVSNSGGVATSLDAYALTRGSHLCYEGCAIEGYGLISSIDLS